jgi:Bacterial regulatory proteins, tetR family
MARPRTITDDDLLRVARDVFLAHGHTATTRQVAEAAGISEAVLYQPPDVDAILGPEATTDDARGYVRRVVVRAGRHFADAIPLGLRLMTHPLFDPSRLGPTPPGGGPSLRDGLAARLNAFVEKGELAAVNTTVAARVLLTLAHDWALAGAMSHGRAANREQELRQMVDAVWDGLRPG